MQILCMVHSWQSLYFKFNNKRYLFGLTHSLAADAAHTAKLKINYLILPTNPYLISASAFMWYLEALDIVMCNNVIVSEHSVKKRLEHLLQSQKSRKMAQLKWEFFRQHQIKEEFLINKLCEAPCPLPLWIQPNSPCYNQSEDLLSIVVPEKGHSLILVNSCDIILIDPSENIEQMLGYYGLPLHSVRAVLLTKANNLNIFECMMKLSKFCLIAEESVYLKLKQMLKNYLYWTDTMIANRMTAKVVVQKEKKHKYRGMEWLVCSSQNGETQYWEICFGLKIIRIYKRKLTHIPHELINNINFEYAVFHDLQESIKKQLQEMPWMYRKKIIFNRATRKYNHQYFTKLQEKHPFVCVKGQLKQDKKRTNLAFQLKEKDINACLREIKAEGRQRLNGKERIVYVRQGYVKDQQGELKDKGAIILGNTQIDCVQRASIMYQPANNLHFYYKHHYIWRQHHSQRKTENLLQKVKQNSFVANLNKKCQTKDRIKGLILTNREEEYEEGSQWDLVNRVCELKTLQSGSNELIGKKCLYLIVKGSLKLSNSEKIANKSMGVGKLKSLYDKQLDQGEEIEVLKDSWVIEIKLQSLHKELFQLYPEKMYELVSKPEVSVSSK